LFKDSSNYYTAKAIDIKIILGITYLAMCAIQDNNNNIGLILSQMDASY
jgi:hypothetical protein